MRWFFGGVVCGFFAVQAFVPWSERLFEPENPAVFGDAFSATMYSDSYVCSAQYELEMTGGDLVRLPIVSFSGGRDRISTRRDVVPAFQSWMCSQFTTGARNTRVRGRVDCRAPRDRFEAAVAPDLCSGFATGGA